MSSAYSWSFVLQTRTLLRNRCNLAYASERGIALYTSTAAFARASGAAYRVSNYTVARRPESRKNCNSPAKCDSSAMSGSVGGVIRSNRNSERSRKISDVRISARSFVATCIKVHTSASS